MHMRILLTTLAAVLVLGCKSTTVVEKGDGSGGDAGTSEGEGEGEGPAEGEGEGPAEGEGEGGPIDDGVWGTECVPGGELCPREGYVCVRVSQEDPEDRAGTCLPRCGPVDETTCAQADCPNGHLCIHVDYSPMIVAKNVCVPLCDPDDPVACPTGLETCAPEIKVSGPDSSEMYFDCEDAFSTSLYVCLP